MKRRLIQMGYVTPDLESALDYWTGVAGAGPFYYAEYEPEQQVHRGQPTHIRFRLAYGFSGDMNIEVVQQLGGGKSAYSEALESGGPFPKGGVLHHIMLAHDGYDGIYSDYITAGAERCYDAFVPGVGRFCYLDTRALMDCYLELVEDTRVFEAACAKMREIHLGWDGRNPRRNFDEILALL
ncbi:MAG: hypothetical protein EPO08_08765 [Rhodospirillaceae bacterium]|nr:MAG: hypothetical protein EPO08_08765 [Rhodospirillaceae bacterium]